MSNLIESIESAMEKWIGKNAVVVGAASGIGEGTTKTFLASGINVIGLDKDFEKLDLDVKTYEGLKGTFHPRKCDISDQSAIDETFKWIEDQFEYVNIIVNSAGIYLNMKLLDESEGASERLNKVMNVNFFGLVQCSRAAVRLMKRSNDFGIVINVCSLLGHSIPCGVHTVNTNVYPSTKYAVRAFSEVLRQELAVENNRKIRVTNVSPGQFE